MKNSALLIFVLLSSLLSAQSVDRNDVIFAAQPGITWNYYQSYDSTVATWKGDHLWGFRTPVSAEYVFGREFGISADFVYTRLAAGTPDPSDFTVLDFGLGLSFHSPSSKRLINWYGETGIHYSKLHYFFHGDFLHETTTANGYGIYYDLGLNMPLSASGKFGMGISLNGGGYKYSKAHLSDNFGNAIDLKLGGLAMSLGLNLYYKL